MSIMLALAGTGILRRGKSLFELAPGDVYFCNADSATTVAAADDGFLYLLAVEISEDSLDSLGPEDRVSELLNPFFVSCSGLIDPVVRASPGISRSLVLAFQAFESADKYGYFTAWSRVIDAVVSINHELEKQGIPGPDPLDLRWTKILNEAVDFIHENFRESISLEDIARHCCISVSGLSQLFKNRMRTSPIKFRNRLRINRGVSLLRTTDLTVERIAEDCGFNDVSSFRRLLFSMTKRAPNDIRSGAAPASEKPGYYS